MKVELWKSKINTYEGYSYNECLRILERQPIAVNEQGVGMDLSLIWSKGIGWHSDPVAEKWTAFLVLYAKNYRFELMSEPSYRFGEQLFAGDIMIWSPHDEHRSIGNGSSDEHAIVTLYKEYQTKPTRKQAREDLMKLLNKEITVNAGQ